MFKRIFIFIFLLNWALIKAQNPPMLVSFEVNRHQNEILVTWEIESGNLCSGLKVEHATDTANFISVYEYPGICGSSTANHRYSFSHMDPAPNKVNYYRINLNVNGNSEILSVFYIKFEENGYSLFSMPIESASKIYFSNDNNEPVNFLVSNSSGSEVLNQKGLKTNEISLGKLVLPIGIYHFNILIGKQKIEGKFVVGK